MEKLLNKLNDAQRSAVEVTEGPIMVIAGAGSGKTRVLTFKIAYLLSKGVDAFNILALTFTNKAAREMKERVHDLIGSSEASNVWMGTFHSIFAKVLRFEAEKIGYPSNFTIYDTDDSKNLIKSIIKEQGLDDKAYQPGYVLNRISSAKSNLISETEYNSNVEIQNSDKAANKPMIGYIFKLYCQRCRKASAMDFDDLLFNMNILLRDFPEVLFKYQNKFKYILVDEYQDTNYAQYLIVKKLAANNENICVVGDDAQSIYAFRGANIQNILNFEKDYPDLKIFKLEQNYRSTKNIVNAANSIIANNKDQIFKEIWTDNDDGTKVKILKASTDNEEGVVVANSIFDNMQNYQLKNSDFAILYRTNAQSRSMEEALRRLNIPYRIYGGLSFYKRKEIKDLLAYFRIVINHNDDEALLRIINYPVRGIGKTSIERLTIISNEENKSIWDIIENVNNYNTGINSGSLQKINDFVIMIKSFSVLLKTKNAYELASQIASSSGVLKDLYQDKTPEGVSRYENIEELLNGIKDFCDKERDNVLEEETSSIRTLDEFMLDIALLTDDEKKDDNDFNKVSLMTIHSAKGLEFPFVYIVGVEENLFPSQLSLSSRADLEEERRLFYVALTRAMRGLAITYAESRYKWGNLNYCEPSRFIDEIDEKYIEYISNKNTGNKTSQKSDANLNSFFKFEGNSLSLKKSVIGGKILNTTTNNVNKPKVENSDFIPDDSSNLQEGMQIEHQKFGVGIVLKIEGTNADTKATVEFAESGIKQLILKYAKIKIVK